MGLLALGWFARGRPRMGWGRVPHNGVPKIVTRPHPIRGRGAVLKPADRLRQVEPEVMT